jgi:small subunit ribosomal protein S1
MLTETGEVVNGFVKCRTRGGMIVDVFGIEAFLPGFSNRCETYP